MASISDVNAKAASYLWNNTSPEGFLMHQTTSQCCRCCCLQPNIDWTVHGYKKDLEATMDKDKLPPELYSITEDAGYWGRTFSFCYPGFRSTTYSVQSSDGNSEEVLVKHKKSISCPINALLAYSDNGPVRIPCCCFLPYLETFDGRTDQKIGSTKVLCNWKPLCCPKFGIFDADDKPKYLLEPNLCCYDQCYECPTCDKGAKCCFIPFYIRDYDTKERLGDDDVAIIDLYVGMKHECCTKRNLYGVKFPKVMTDAEKATMMGATLIYDITINEQMY